MTMNILGCDVSGEISASIFKSNVGIIPSKEPTTFHDDEHSRL
jgi:hypothetical protein